MSAYLDYIPQVMSKINTMVADGHAKYGDSCLSRGPVGLYMMLARKWDRLDKSGKEHNYDMDAAIVANPPPDGLIDDIDDLIVYLVIMRADWLARMNTTQYPGIPNERLPNGVKKGMYVPPTKMECSDGIKPTPGYGHLDDNLRQLASEQQPPTGKKKKRKITPLADLEYVEPGAEPEAHGYVAQDPKDIIFQATRHQREADLTQHNDAKAGRKRGGNTEHPAPFGYEEDGEET